MVEKRDEDNGHILTITLDIVDETGRKWGFPVERLRVENIPGAWRLTRADSRDYRPDYLERPGIGVSRHEAVADWLGKNHSSKRFANRIDVTDLRKKLDHARQVLVDLQTKINY